MFISVHSDAGPEVARGATVFDSVDLSNEQLAIDLGKAVANALGTRFRGHAEKESKKFPGEDYYTAIDIPQDGGIPVVLLLEREFHSNPVGESLLLNDELTKASAEAMAKVIKAYYGIPDLTANDLVWELSQRGILTDTALWKEKLTQDKNLYWLVFKFYKYLQSKNV
jgi:N-acetylmuramoyl-L-alanine amidase